MDSRTTDIIAKAKARLIEVKAAKEAATQQMLQTLASSQAVHTMEIPSLSGWQIDTSREWNAQQHSAILAGLSGKSFCLIGAAGTGKTSTLKGMVNSMLSNGLLPYFSQQKTTKYLLVGRPGIVLCSFTNMAVRQIAKHFTKDITTLTCHKLVEYAPVYYEVTGEDGTPKNTMRFEPTRNRLNTLPRELKTIVVDESSMVDTQRIAEILDAHPNPDSLQWIFLGDLNQLPPVYGQAILGRKLLELPIIELTQVYRQALESPIISLAIKMKDGDAIPVSEKIVIDKGEHGKLTIHPWSKSISAEDACTLAANHMKAAILNKLFDPNKDMILCPYNVSFGVQELNRNISDWLGRQRNAQVFEVIAGFNTHYYAVGDKVLVNKREAIITRIQRNREYSGKRPINTDIYDIDRWGGARKKVVTTGVTGTVSEYEESNSDLDVDAILANLSATHTTIEDRKASSSHTITVRFKTDYPIELWQATDTTLIDPDLETVILGSASEVNEMLFSYAITVHKSQGSEWRKVFLLLHSSHSAMCSRELLYTAITRAAKELYIICEPDRGMKAGTLTKAAKAPRLVGNNLAEKLVSLKAKFELEERELIKRPTNVTKPNEEIT